MKLTVEECINTLQQYPKDAVLQHIDWFGVPHDVEVREFNEKTNTVYTSFSGVDNLGF